MSEKILNITSGDCSGEIIEKSGVPGEVFVWHDIMYDGPVREQGFLDEKSLLARTEFLATETGGGLKEDMVFETLQRQYKKLLDSGGYDEIILWFDACLFDQSMLVHILTCLYSIGVEKVQLLCVDFFPGIEPYNGLGQLDPEQMASVYDHRQPVSEKQFEYAMCVDYAFGIQDRELFANLAEQRYAPLPWVPAAIARWMKEQPDPETGLGQLASLALEAIKNGNETPVEIFKAVAEADITPQYWGDTTLWGKINSLADRGMVKIEGPNDRLPQWTDGPDLKEFRCLMLENREVKSPNLNITKSSISKR